MGIHKHAQTLFCNTDARLRGSLSPNLENDFWRFVRATYVSKHYFDISTGEQGNDEYAKTQFPFFLSIRGGVSEIRPLFARTPWYKCTPEFKVLRPGSFDWAVMSDSVSQSVIRAVLLIHIDIQIQVHSTSHGVMRCGQNARRLDWACTSWTAFRKQDMSYSVHYYHIFSTVHQMNINKYRFVLRNREAYTQSHC